MEHFLQKVRANESNGEKSFSLSVSRDCEMGFLSTNSLSLTATVNCIELGMRIRVSMKLRLSQKRRDIREISNDVKYGLIQIVLGNSDGLSEMENHELI
jgi:hypothetical protein